MKANNDVGTGPSGWHENCFIHGELSFNFSPTSPLWENEISKGAILNCYSQDGTK